MHHVGCLLQGCVYNENRDLYYYDIAASIAACTGIG